MEKIETALLSLKRPGDSVTVQVADIKEMDQYRRWLMLRGWSSFPDAFTMTLPCAPGSGVLTVNLAPGEQYDGEKSICQVSRWPAVNPKGETNHGLDIHTGMESQGPDQ